MFIDYSGGPESPPIESERVTPKVLDTLIDADQPDPVLAARQNVFIIDGWPYRIHRPGPINLWGGRPNDD